MLESEWLTAALAIVLGAHLLTLGYVALSRGRDTAARTAEAPEEEDEEAVRRCAECGATNDPSYRFCRNCVAELPAAARPTISTGRQSHPN